MTNTKDAKPTHNSQLTTHNSLVPKLRFPEFQDAGPWEVRSIKQLASKITQGGTPNTSVSEYWNGEIPWITPAEMGDDAEHHYTATTCRSISREGLDNSSAELLPANSVIISSRAPIGYVTINKVEMATNQGCKGIIPKEDIYHEFLYFSFLVAKQRLNDLGAGAGFKEISLSALKAFLISVPSLPEQQKIADCLSSLDEVIELEAKKLEALKLHKKGLMQQLFPDLPNNSSLTTHHSQLIPRLRFPEFRDAGQWEVKRLGEVCDMQAGNFIPARKIRPEQSQGLNPCYGGNGLRGFTESFTHIGSFPLIGRQGAYCGNVQLAEGKFHATEHAIVTTPTKNTNTKFLYFLLLRADLSRLATGQAQPGLSVMQLNGVPVPVPSEPEQQKIADCLSYLDEVIEIQSKKLDVLKLHKKGLMQQLFPQEVG